jgi:hypothetical protein
MATHCTYTASVLMPDGSTAEHTAEALAYRHMSDGSVAVLAACCGVVGGTLCDACNGVGCQRCGHRGVIGQIVCPTCAGIRGAPPCPNCNGRGELKTEDTRSWHSFYDIGMPTSDGKGGLLPPIDPAAEVAKHVQNVAERHAARHKAKAFNLEALMKPRGGANQLTSAIPPQAKQP